MTWFKSAFWIQVQDPNPSRFGIPKCRSLSKTTISIVKNLFQTYCYENKNLCLLTVYFALQTSNWLPDCFMPAYTSNV